MTEYISLIDRHVERAFDMLRELYGFLHPPYPLAPAELEQVMPQLLPVAQHWLGLAAPAQIPLLMDVMAALPDQQKVADRLAGVRVHEERKKALQALAEREVGESIARIGVVATFRECANNWRGVLPHPYHLDGAYPILWQHEREALLATSFYWSGPLGDRHTRLGPSYRLLKAAIRLAEAAVAIGMDPSRTRPCSELRQTIQAMPDWCGEFNPAKRTERLDRGLAALSEALMVADEVELREFALKQEPSPASRSTTPAPQICNVEYPAKDVARITEGSTIVTIKGPSRVQLLRFVTDRPGQPVLWTEVLKARMAECAEGLDRRRNSRAGRSSSSSGHHRGLEVTPRIALKPASIQHLGSRLKEQLGKLGYHWNQDGTGATWHPECT